MIDTTKINVGIVGLGYVGGALRNAIQRGIDKPLGGRPGDESAYPYRLFTYDINNATNPTEKSLDDLVSKTDIIFVCVPTPMHSTGQSDLSIVEQVMNDINFYARSHKIVVIKSTIPPGMTSKFQEQYKHHAILFNPEFLTEANSEMDFLRNDIIIGKPAHTSPIAAKFAAECLDNIIRIVNVRYVKTFIVEAEEAELFKYLANLFLATKVSFANEMYHMAEEVGVEWEHLLPLIYNDSRLGTTHWNVPGPDGQFGFGGSCVKPTTKVITPFGSEEIQNLLANDMIMSTTEIIDKTESKKIKSVNNREYIGDLYEFQLLSGNFQCTSDHLMPVMRDGVTLLIPAKDVRLTDSVYTYIKG